MVFEKLKTIALRLMLFCAIPKICKIPLILVTVYKHGNPFAHNCSSKRDSGCDLNPSVLGFTSPELYKCEPKPTYPSKLQLNLQTFIPLLGNEVSGTYIADVVFKLWLVVCFTVVAVI